VLAAAAAVCGMVLFAQAANRDNRLVNWFGIVTALGGAFSFELLKYASTTKARHLEELATRINLTPAKQNELATLVEEVDKTRRLYSGISTAVELRAKALALEFERKQLIARAQDVQQASVDIAKRHHRLALDVEANESAELAREMAEVVGKLGISKQERMLDQLWKSIGAVPGLPAGFLLGKLAEAGQHQIERIFAKRARARVAQLVLEGSITSGSDQSAATTDKQHSNAHDISP
jgi:hypothetical protein